MSHPRLEGNEAECLEVSRVGIPDYSMYCLTIGSIERTQNIFHKSLNSVRHKFEFLKNVKNARDVNKGTPLAPNFICSMCPSMRSYKRYLACEQAYCLLSAVLNEYTVAIIVRVAQDGIYFCSFVSHKNTKNF